MAIIARLFMYSSANFFMSEGNRSLKEKTAKDYFGGGFSKRHATVGKSLLFRKIFLTRGFAHSGRLWNGGNVGYLLPHCQFDTGERFHESRHLSTRKEVTHNDYNAVFWFNAAINLSLYLLLFLCAPLITEFYRSPELTPLARYSFIGFFIASLGISHSAYLLRNLMVKQRALSSVIRGLPYPESQSHSLPTSGFSYWGIATQSIVYVASTQPVTGISPLATEL